MSENTESPTIIKEHYPDGRVKETYHEKMIGKTLYRVTSVHQDKVDLQKALEELAVKKVLREINGL